VSELVARRLNFKRRFALLPALLVLVMPGMFGQTSTGQSGTAVQPTSTQAKIPAFDIVSIKPNRSGSGSMGIETHSDSYSATNVSLKRLLRDAYDIREDLISGLPGWAENTSFDIKAKVVDPNLDELKKLSNEQRRSMLQTFLMDRFQLKVHTETRTLPVYELVVAKGGPKFHEAAASNGAADGSKTPGMWIHNNELTATAIPLTSLAAMLARQLHRTVLDKTGLSAKYDLDLKWAPEEGQDSSPDSSSPSIFTALQEQLGLKLQSSKGSVETLVVDHVEIPSEN
jgi:uncharacterized protein (TIGR03435 family)